MNGLLAFPLPTTGSVYYTECYQKSILMKDSQAVPSMEEFFSEADNPGGNVTDSRDQAHRKEAREARDSEEEGQGGWKASPLPKLQRFFRQHAVLLTGAGGTVGSALAQRLASLPLRQLLLLDTSEHGLVRLKDQLDRGRSSSNTNPPTEYLLADLRQVSDRERALRREPSIVIHAAAYKHVPFLEDRPIAAVENNLLATIDWFETCRREGSVEHFVFVSTDKATRPSGVMGATKAAAERALRILRARRRRSEVTSEAETGPEAKIVRLCNVFGSRGSVVPLFWKRLQEGRSLPVTHPDMRRRFISTRSAATAILRTLPHRAGTYVPTKGREVTIGALAHRLVRYAREDADPAEWIHYTGRRRGERLRERLLASRERPGTDVGGGLLRAADLESLRSQESFVGEIEKLRSACQGGEEETVRSGLWKLVHRSTQEVDSSSAPL